MKSGDHFLCLLPIYSGFGYSRCLRSSSAGACHLPFSNLRGWPITPTGLGAFMASCMPGQLGKPGVELLSTRGFATAGSPLLLWPRVGATMDCLRRPPCLNRNHNRRYLGWPHIVLPCYFSTPKLFTTPAERIFDFPRAPFRRLIVMPPVKITNTTSGRPCGQADLEIRQRPARFVRRI